MKVWVTPLELWSTKIPRERQVGGPILNDSKGLRKSSANGERKIKEAIFIPFLAQCNYLPSVPNSLSIFI